MKRWEEKQRRIKEEMCRKVDERKEKKIRRAKIGEKKKEI